MSSHVQHFRALAAYNSWINERLYRVAETLPEVERKRNLRAFFGSLHGTLNHVLVADRFLLGRFRAVQPSSRVLDSALVLDDFVPDLELCAEFAVLRAERCKTDETIEHWTAEFSDELLNLRLPDGRPYWFMLAHFFNHQTHHRGQVTTLLSQLGAEPGVTDFSALPGSPERRSPSAAV
jgi:uncharacterized damage-inducible protein DinB